MTPQEAIEFMRENKILSLKTKDLELVLHPEALLTPEKEPEVEQELDDKEIGLSGLTRKRQKELLGVVIPSDFKSQVR